MDVRPELINAIKTRSTRQILDAVKMIENEDLSVTENRMVRDALVSEMCNRAPHLTELINDWSEDVEDLRSMGNVVIDQFVASPSTFRQVRVV